MTIAMSNKTLVDGFAKKGYTVDAKRRLCPSCMAVFTARRAKRNQTPDQELMDKITRKAFVFRKKDAQPVAACPCGFRRTLVKDENGKLVRLEHKGILWAEEFGAAGKHVEDVDDTPPVDNSRVGKCTATKKNGELCNNNSLAGCDKCGVHGGERMF